MRQASAYITCVIAFMFHWFEMHAAVGSEAADDPQILCVVVVPEQPPCRRYSG